VRNKLCNVDVVPAAIPPHEEPADVDSMHAASDSILPDVFVPDILALALLRLSFNEGRGHNMIA